MAAYTRLERAPVLMKLTVNYQLFLRCISHLFFWGIGFAVDGHSLNESTAVATTPTSRLCITSFFNEAVYAAEAYATPVKQRKKASKRTARVKSNRRKSPKAKATASSRRSKTGASVHVLPFLGRRHARVSVVDQQLSGVVYYLASGHGGPDPGAIGRYGSQLLPEDEYAYDVTVRLARALTEHGATVYMIVQDPDDGIRDAGVLKMDQDELAYPKQRIPLDHTARLRQATTAVNRLYAKHKGSYQRFVTIHVDSRSKGETIDVFFYHNSRSAAGQRLAKYVHRSFTVNYKRSQPGRPYLGRVTTRNSLYVIKNSHPPTLFIELGNIQNKKDQRRFLVADNRQALANWLYQGLAADYRSRR